MTGIIADEANGECSTPALRAGGAVQGEHVEEQGIAWFELPPEDREGLTVGLDIG